MMTPRERVLAALKHQAVDRIPWIEGIVQNGRSGDSPCSGHGETGMGRRRTAGP